MNISEANAVNVVLLAMDPTLATHRQTPTTAATRDAARLLLKGASKALGAPYFTPTREKPVMSEPFPLTQSEAIAAASLITTHVAEKAGLAAVADLLPRWKGWAERLSRWGEANLATGGMVELDPNDVRSIWNATLPAQGIVDAPADQHELVVPPAPDRMSTVDLVAALRASVEAAKTRREAGEQR